MMKNKLSLIVLLIALLMTLSLYSCASDKDSKESTGGNTEVSGSTSEIDEKTSIYLNAYDTSAKALKNADKLHMDVQISRKTEYGTDTIEALIVRKADYTNIGKDNFLAVIEDKNIIGKKVYNTTEIYNNATEYLIVSDEYEAGFYETSDAEAFTQRQIPAVLIDPKLYTDVKCDKSVENTLIFSSPTSAEIFALKDSGKMISAEGTVTLTNDGDIEKMSYTITYELGPAIFTETITSKVKTDSSNASIYDVPAKETCLEVKDITLPSLMYYSKMATYGITALKANNTTTVASEAGAISKIQSESIAFFESDKVSFIGLDTVNLNTTYLGETSTYEWEYRFEDDIATYNSEDGTETVDLSADEFQNQFFASAEVLTHFFDVTSINATKTENYIIIDFELPESVSSSYKNLVCEHFFNDASYLDSLADEYKDYGISGYVTIDLDTLLPVSESFIYTGEHIFDGESYKLIFSREVTLYPSTEDAHVQITGDVAPTTAPTDLAKPLFYEITSPEGNKMYLLGTIHVGDNRTSYLPSEIYDAFASSDALAVESDILDFEEKLKNDANLMAYISEVYYLDDAPLSEYISEENYGEVSKLSKVYGISQYIDVMKPSVIASDIELNKINSGGKYSSERGVDMVLSRLAKKQNKEILEVETVEQHYGIYTKYSDALQEYLLEECMNIPRNEMLDSTDELFELWCEGDEEKLKEYIRKSDVPEEATEEEIQLYNEYCDILLVQRDTIMVNKAKQYLSDEKVEFFAVGLAHLLSETGLVDTLRAEGYTVELVEYK